MSSDAGNAMNQVSVKFFGSLRGQVPNDELLIELPSGAHVSALRAELVRRVRDGELSISEKMLADSALASDETLLSEESVVDVPSVNILPPVCGG